MGSMCGGHFFFFFKLPSVLHSYHFLSLCKISFASRILSYWLFFLMTVAPGVLCGRGGMLYMSSSFLKLIWLVVHSYAFEIDCLVMWDVRFPCPAVLKFDESGYMRFSEGYYRNTCCFLYVPWPWIKPTTSACSDDALTNWPTSPGPS